MRFKTNNIVIEKETKKMYLIADIQEGTNAYLCVEMDEDAFMPKPNAKTYYIYDESLESFVEPSDTGYMIVHLPSKTYYNGMNQFDKQVRNGKIYHKLNRIMETLSYYFEKNKDRNPNYVDLDKSHYAICEVSLCVNCVNYVDANTL